MDCIFCRIAAGEIPSDRVYEDEHVIAFRDIHPQAPVHVLIAPKRHMKNVLEMDGDTAVAVLSAVKKVAELEGVSQTGFRAITNCGRDGAQSVDHLHIHVLGGRKLSEQMA